MRFWGGRFGIRLSLASQMVRATSINEILLRLLGGVTSTLIFINGHKVGLRRLGSSTNRLCKHAIPLASSSPGDAPITSSFLALPPSSTLNKKLAQPLQQEGALRSLCSIGRLIIYVD